ncbi:MAG: hypothetical protein F7C34_03665 [Desulfurococcales archaeon]|nr:hypothetical protein [Desulfurococcales archaeon]
MRVGLVHVEAALIALLIIAYLAINLVADLPRFLIGENLALALAYAASLTLILRGYSAGQPLTLFVSAFNAGRVSRSIVSPRGEVQELALQHVPLLALILLVSIIALVVLARRGC